MRKTVLDLGSTSLSILNQKKFTTYKEFHLYDYLQSLEKKEEGMRG